ncbi:MAG: hypothetical protein Q9200_005200 [Gallowayella weberi]
MADFSQIQNKTRGPQYLAAIWVTFAAATFTFTLRMWQRVKTKSIGWDDYFISVAMLSVTLGSICGTLRVHYGAGRHVQYVLPTLSRAIEWTMIGHSVSYFSIFFVKISVCFFILRVIKGTHRTSRFSVYCLMVLLTLSTIAAIVANCIVCIPLRKLWNPKLAGTCFSRSMLDHVTRTFAGRVVSLHSFLYDVHMLI